RLLRTGPFRCTCPAVSAALGGCEASIYSCWLGSRSVRRALKSLDPRPPVTCRDRDEDDSPMLRLRLKVLGGFEARIGSGQPRDIPTRKTRALLAYLAVPAGRAHTRDKLTGLLWSDRGDEQARNSLRQALTELGRILADVDPSPLVKGRDTLAL